MKPFEAVIGQNLQVGEAIDFTMRPESTFVNLGTFANNAFEGVSDFVAKGKRAAGIAVSGLALATSGALVVEAIVPGTAAGQEAVDPNADGAGPVPDPTDSQAQQIKITQCRSMDGLNAFSSLNFKAKSKSSKTVNLNSVTSNIEKCDPYGQRTIRSVVITSKGDHHSSWKKAGSDVIDDITTNESIKINKIVKLNNQCKAGDKAMMLRAVTKVSYFDNQTNKTYDATIKNGFAVPTSVPCK